MKLLISLLLILSVTTMANWEESKNKCGIKVSLKKIKGSKIKAFKVEGIIKQKPETIIKALMDLDNFYKWHDSIKKSEVLKTINPNKSLAYMEIDFPWPVSNRDSYATSELVLEGKTSKVLVQDSKDKKLQGKNIKVKKTQGYWSVEPHNDGAYVFQQMHAEPGGSIPNWVINMMLDKSPYKTFKGLRKYLGGKGCHK